MKKIFSFLLTVAALAGIVSSCSDVPMPYDVNHGDTASKGVKLPYRSATLYTGWTTHSLTEYNPWSQGSSYTQATGYQKWDGSDTKTNKQVEGYLISPAINTTCASGKVKVTFDHVIGYANNDANYKEHVGFFVSKDYDGTNFETSTWTKINFNITPEACNSNWTLVNVGELQVPDEFVNIDGVHFAFYMKSASADKSITWEPMNFYAVEGVAGDNPNPDPQPGGQGTKESPLTVAQAQALTGNAYVTGYIVGYVDGTKFEEGAKFEVPSVAETEILIAATPDETNPANAMPVQLPTGAIRSALELSAHPQLFKKQVILYGSIETYFGVPGLKSTSWARIEGSDYGTDPEGGDQPSGDPKGTGTLADPYNAAAANAYISTLAADAESASDIYVKGKICSIKEAPTAQYGNATFYISDDGTSAGEQFYCFRVFYLGNNKFTGSETLNIGDEVIICGKLVNYKGNTPETAANKAYIYSLNGKTEGGDNPDPKPDPSGNGIVTVDGTTVTLTNPAVIAGTTTATAILTSLGYENGAPVPGFSMLDGTSISFDKGSNTNEPKYYTATNGIRVYANNIITFDAEKPIAKIEFECDEYNGTKYVGNTEQTVDFDGSTATYTNSYTGSGGGTQLRIKTITITYAQ